MEQFQQVGEILGSLKALMVLKHEISINQRQCCLLYDMLELAFETISQEIRQNLRLDERNTKWKALELPMKELHRVFREADLYIRQCIDVKDWWGRAISLHMNRDCLELHIHNLLCCFPVVIEALETAAEASGVDQEDMHKKRIALMQKYEQECFDPKLFLWKFGKQYLVPREMCSRMETAWREDRWLLLERVREKKMAAVGNLAKYEQRLVELLTGKLSDGDTSKGKLLPGSVLGGAKDYFVRRRLDSGYGTGGGHLKEIHWMGESFALRTFYGDIGPVLSEISSVLLLSHPNVLQYLCALYDEGRKEGFLVMELMSKDLGSFMKENCGQRNRIPLPIPVAVDIMLQIARGLEYLHSKKIYHGELHPSNILLKAKNPSIGGFQVKVAGYALSSLRNYTSRSPKPPEVDLDIWLAPEVLTEQEKPGNKCTAKYTEKADVYSFGMICFELLTGKVPFEDGHLQGDKMVRNIRAGERPLFSYPAPKYLTNLTKKCWQTNPHLRPSFSSICRILRYIKKTLVINPEHGHPDSPPSLVDYCDMDAGYLRKLLGEGSMDVAPVLQIPFQMFAYKVVEKEKINSKKWDSATEGSSVHRPASMFDDEQLAAMDDLFLVPTDQRSVCSEIIESRYSGIGVDARSVISEMPHIKLYGYDQRSIGSVSPGRSFSTVTAADQSLVSAATPERKTVFTDQKLKVEVPHKVAIACKVADNKLTSPTPPENSRPPLEKNEILERRQSLRPIVDRKETTELLERRHFLVDKKENTKLLEKKQLSKSIVIKKEDTELTEKKQLVDKKRASSEEKISAPDMEHQKLAEIPEKETLQNNPKRISVSFATSEKRTESTAESIENSGKSENPEKLRPSRKLKFTKTKKVAGTRKDNLPKPLPAKMKQTRPSFSPASSPSRAFKSYGYSGAPKDESPRSSPARMKKTMPVSSPASSPLRSFNNFSPASSPLRTFRACASPGHPSAYISKEYSSPMSSPMNPSCSRYSRLSRENPQRPKTDHRVWTQ